MIIEKVSLPIARKIKGITQTQLAKACNVSVSTVSNWERGKTEPTVSQAKKIANICGVKIDDIKFLA